MCTFSHSLTPLGKINKLNTHPYTKNFPRNLISRTSKEESHATRLAIITVGQTRQSLAYNKAGARARQQVRGIEMSRAFGNVPSSIAPLIRDNLARAGGRDDGRYKWGRLAGFRIKKRAARGFAYSSRGNRAERT